MILSQQVDVDVGMEDTLEEESEHEEKINAGSDKLQPAGDNFSPQISGDNAMPNSSNEHMIEQPASKDTTVSSAVDIVSATQVASLPDHVTSKSSPKIASAVNKATPAFTALPSATPLAHAQPPLPKSVPSTSSSSSAAVAAITASQSVKEDKELARLREAFEGVPPKLKHKFLRKEWRDFLFGPYEEDHVSYILRACMKNSPSTAIGRGLREALNIASHRETILPKILEEITVDELLSQVPRQVLNGALARRLKVAPVQDLVRWLADAGRLGFKHDDVIQEGDEIVTPKIALTGGLSRVDAIMLDAPQQPESKIPPHNKDVVSESKDSVLIEQERQAAIRRQNLLIKRQKQELERQSRTASRPLPLPSAPQRNKIYPTDSQQAMLEDNPDLKCRLCGFVCLTQSIYLYHVSKKVCQRQLSTASWQWGCESCNQTFTTKQGQAYHLLKRVCHGDSSDDGLADDTPEDHDAAASAQLLGQNPPCDPVPPPSRPTFSTGPCSSASQTEPPPALPRGGPPVQISRPPMHTPVSLLATPQTHAQRGRPPNNARNQVGSALQGVDPTARISPSQLSAAKKDEMDRQIAAEDLRYQNALAAINPQMPLKDQEKRRIALKNGNASKKSQIRRSFGVTLRMRDKDKVASRAVAIATGLHPPKPSGSVQAPVLSSPHVPNRVSPPSSGFSAINGPPCQNPAPPNNRANHPSPKDGQGEQPRLSVSRGNPSGQNITNPNEPTIAGFGILTSRPPPQHRTAKRRRTSSGTASPVTPPVGIFLPSNQRASVIYGQGAGIGMSEASAGDASKKYPKKVNVGAAQARWESLQPKQGLSNIQTNGNGKRKASDAAPTHNTPNRPTSSGNFGRAGSNTGAEPIEIVISSDSEETELPTNGPKVAMDDGATTSDGARSNGGAMADADKPLLSTEDTESESTGGSRPSSSGGARVE